MKALSIKQPWASLIAKGIKDVENRTWRTNFRGRIFIHASQKISVGVRYTPEQDEKLCSVNDAGESGPRGAIIGEVEIIDCIDNSTSVWAEPGCYHWILANAKLYGSYFPCNGSLSFWEPPAGLVKI
jgi:hypothetical protein